MKSAARTKIHPIWDANFVVELPLLIVRPSTLCGLDAKNIRKAVLPQAKSITRSK
jgi:hypothetical protein